MFASGTSRCSLHVVLMIQLFSYESADHGVMLYDVTNRKCLADMVIFIFCAYKPSLLNKHHLFYVLNPSV